MGRKIPTGEYLRRALQRMSGADLSRDLGRSRGFIGKLQAGKLDDKPYRAEIIRAARGFKVRPVQ